MHDSRPEGAKENPHSVQAVRVEVDKLEIGDTAALACRKCIGKV
jgi:hypothetical protein